MNIGIIAGKCNELNNLEVFSLLKNRDKNKKHIIIAPDRTLFSLEQRLFDELNEDCFFDISVVSFTNLSKQLLTNNQSNILTKQSGIAIVNSLLKTNQDKLLAFKKAINYIGFASELFETICLYKSCNILPNDIYTDDTSSYSNLKQKDIKLIYTLYEEYLQKDYTDSFNQLKLFAKLINKDTYKNTIFYFVEFEDFTSIMYDIIYKIAKFSDGCYICATYGKENNNANIYSNKVYYDLIDLFKSNGLEFKINKLGLFEDKEKNIILDNVFSYEPQKHNTTSSIRINSFDKINEEVRFVIYDIYNKVKAGGCDFSKFSLVVPSLLEYKNYLIDEFKSLSIPYYIDENIKFNEHEIIRLIFDIVEIINGEYNVKLLTNMLKSPILNFDKDSVLNYDNYLISIGAKNYNAINISLVDGDLAEFFELIGSLKSLVSNNLECGEYINKIILVIYQYILGRGEDYFNNQTSLQKRIFSQVKSKIDTINKDFLLVFKNQNIQFNEFIDNYKIYYENTNLSLPPITSNTLFVADFNSSYITKVDNLYILGANEGKLPKYKLDNGLVTDEEIAKLPNSKKINPTINALNVRKQFKLFELLFKSKNINISYVLTDGEGKCYYNNLINSLIQIFDLKINYMSPIFDIINNSYSKLNIDNVLFNNPNKEIALYNLIQCIKNWNIYKNNNYYREFLSSLYYSLENKDEIINNYNKSSAYNKLTGINLFKDNTTSISQIETYNNCPYKHFVSYGLRLRESISSRFKANDIGTIIHDVLKSLVPFILKNLENLEMIYEKAHSLLDYNLSKDSYKHIVENEANIFVIKSLHKELNRIAYAIYNEIKSSSFVPTKYEFKFGGLDIKVNNIKITGAIDRIDEFEDKFIIFDYKTGDNSFNNFNDVYSGKKLQLLVYAWSYMHMTNKTPVGMFYFPISNSLGTEENVNYKLNGVMRGEDNIITNIDKNLSEPNYSSKIINLRRKSDGNIYPNNCFKFLCLNKDDMDYLLKFTIGQVEKSINNILSGNISPNPLKDGQFNSCTYCNYKGLCLYLNDNFKEVEKVESIQKIKEKENKNGEV